MIIKLGDNTLFAKNRRCIRFLKMAMKSDNVAVRTIMGIEEFHSVMGGNI